MIPTLPTAPSRNDPSTFAARADAFLAALDPWGTAANTLGTAMQTDADIANSLAAAFQLPGYRGVSTSSITFGTGSKTLTVATNLLFVAGMEVTLAYGPNPATYMQGTVTSYLSGTLVLNITSSNSTGTFTDWLVTPTNTTFLTRDLSNTTGQLAGFRNRIINGGCVVAHRPANVALTNNNSSIVFGGADRIGAKIASFTSVSSATLAAVSLAGSSSGYGQSITITATGTGTASFITSVESYSTRDLSGKTITISALVYASGGGSSISAAITLVRPNSLQDNYGVTASISGTSTPSAVPLGTLTRVTQTFTLGASEGLYGLRPTVTLSNVSAPSGAVLYVSDWQLEVGALPTVFEHRPANLEAILCSRFYQAISVFFAGTVVSGQIYLAPVALQGAMRNSVSASLLTNITNTLFPTSLATMYNGVGLGTNFTSVSSVVAGKTASSSGFGTFNDVIALDAEIY